VGIVLVERTSEVLVVKTICVELYTTVEFTSLVVRTAAVLVVKVKLVKMLVLVTGIVLVDRTSRVELTIEVSGIIEVRVMLNTDVCGTIVVDV